MNLSLEELIRLQKERRLYYPKEHCEKRLNSKEYLYDEDIKEYIKLNCAPESIDESHAFRVNLILGRNGISSYSDTVTAGLPLRSSSSFAYKNDDIDLDGLIYRNQKVLRHIINNRYFFVGRMTRDLHLFQSRQNYGVDLSQRNLCFLVSSAILITLAVTFSFILQPCADVMLPVYSFIGNGTLTAVQMLAFQVGLISSATFAMGIFAYSKSSSCVKSNPEDLDNHATHPCEIELTNLSNGPNK